MRSLLKIGLISMIILVALVWGVSTHRSMQTSYEHQLAQESLRREFLERAPWVWSIEDPETYRQEIRGLFRWYTEALDELGERFPSETQAHDAFLHDLEERHASGRMQQAEYEGYKESYLQVEQVFEQIARGTYAPVMTGTHGGLRIDFLEAAPAVVDGQQALRGRFVVWGAQRSRIEERLGKGSHARIEVHASFRDVEVKLANGRGRPLGQLTFGLPFGSYVPVPEQRIEAFPPLGFVGDYAIPLVPHEAEEMEMTVTLLSRAITGTPIRGDFSWKEPVPVSWKLREGEVWEDATIRHQEDL